MENFIEFDAFTKLAENAGTRRVTRGGYIVLQGRKYHHEKLISLVGQHVKAFVDDSIDGADAICFNFISNEHICNASNPELWNVITAELNNLSL